MSHASLFAERKKTIIGTCNLAHLTENLEAAHRATLSVKLTARVAKAT